MPFRVAMITRRFWPLVGGAEMAMANLAVGLRELGAQCRIVTAQWEPQWPKELVHRETPVTRLAQPSVRGWGTLRYMWRLGTWLRKHKAEFDAVLVSMLKHDAYAALVSLESTKIPVVIRAEGAGESGDCVWHKQARFGMRIRGRCRQAKALIAPSPSIADELRAAQFPSESVFEIANGVAVPPPRTRERRSLARMALADANPDLIASDDTPVAVFTGRLHPAKGLFDLVKAWEGVVEALPNARLWIVGEGPLRDELYSYIRERQVHPFISMPGAFDDVDEVLAAADCFVLPSYEEGMSIALLEAMAAGLPVIASDIPGNRRLIEPSETGILTPSRDPQSLAREIVAVLRSVNSHDRSPQRLGENARMLVETRYSLRQMAARHLEVLQTVASA